MEFPRVRVLSIAATAARWQMVFFGNDIRSKAALLQAEPLLANLPIVYNGIGRYPLALAASQGDTAFIDLLLDAGAEINRVDRYGDTALTMLIKIGHPGPMTDDQQRTVRVLLAKGANRNRGRPTATTYAYQYPDRGSVLQTMNARDLFGSDDEDELTMSGLFEGADGRAQARF